MVQRIFISMPLKVFVNSGGRVSSKDKNFKQKCEDQLNILDGWDWKGEVVQSNQPSVREVWAFLRATHFTCAGIAINAHVVNLHAGEMNKGSPNKR